MADRDAYLYVLGADCGPCKVGWSEDVSRRSRYAENPVGPTDVLYFAPVAYRFALSAERYAHWILRDHHFRNEWFNVNSASAIDAVNKAVTLDFERLGLIPRLLDFYGMPRFPKGTWKQIDAVLCEGEKRSDLIREAVEREIKRRQRQAA